MKDRRVGPVWNAHVDNIAHRVNGEIPRWAGRSYGWRWIRCRHGAPLGSLAGRRTLETMLVARGGHSHFHGMLGVVNQGTETFDSLEPPPSSEESKGSPALLIKTKAQPVQRDRPENSSKPLSQPNSAIRPGAVRELANLFRCACYSAPN